MSTQQTHTPGPWHVAYYGESERQIIKRGSLSLAELLTWSSGPESKTQVEANARLMAAAPDLLRALEKISADWGLCAPNSIIEARAAISKAKHAFGVREVAGEPYGDSPEGHDAAMIADEARDAMRNTPFIK